MSERIYVIEDDENIQEIIKLSLESSGYSITLFNNAIDAIVAIHEDTPDLAIFDVMLPELDGIDNMPNKWIELIKLASEYSKPYSE